MAKGKNRKHQRAASKEEDVENMAPMKMVKLNESKPDEYPQEYPAEITQPESIPVDEGLVEMSAQPGFVTPVSTLHSPKSALDYPERETLQVEETKPGESRTWKFLKIAAVPIALALGFALLFKSRKIRQ